VSRTWRIGLVAFCAVAAIAAVATVLSPRLLPPADTAIHVAGNVQAPLVTIAGPSIASPVPDYAVGIPGAADSAARPTVASTRPGASSRQPVVSGLLATVTVSQGEHVATSQVVAQIDGGLLDLGVTAAKAAYERTRAQAGVLDDTLATLNDSRAELASTRAKLEKTLADAVAGRATLAAQLAQLEAMIPPGSPTPTPTVPPAPPTPQQLVAQLKTALAKLDAGIARMRAGLAKLATGAARLADARSQVRSGRDMLEVLADGRAIAIRVAEARRDVAKIVTQVSGLVVFARPAGTVVMVGTPIVRVVPDTPCRIDTYLTSEQVALVLLGGDAYVDFDSNTRGPLHGRITRIGETAQFPPTSFPTGIVHMTQTVLVTIMLDDGRAPAGTPVDVTLPTD